MSNTQLDIAVMLYKIAAKGKMTDEYLEERYKMDWVRMSLTSSAKRRLLAEQRRTR